MLNRVEVLLKRLLIVFMLSALHLSHCYPSYFFRYPKVEKIGDQTYLSATFLLSTKLFYPELQIIRLPGAAIRFMRSKSALPDIGIRLLTRCQTSYKYSGAPKDHFALALVTNIVINQSWNSGWTTNNPNRKIMLSTSGPAFETRTNTITNISTHLQPLLDGLRKASITSAEITAAKNAILLNIGGKSTGAANIHKDVMAWLPYSGSSDISTSGSRLQAKTFLDWFWNVAYALNKTYSIKIAQASLALKFIQNSPLEIFVVSSDAIRSQDLIQNLMPLIFAHQPNPHHAIMVNNGSPGAASKKLSISHSAALPAGGVVLLPIGTMSPITLTVGEIVKQQFVTLTNPLAICDCQATWMVLGQTVYVIIYTGKNCSVQATVGSTGEHITEYFVQTLVPKLQTFLTAAYLEARLLSSWKNYLGELQQKTMSLDAWAAATNNQDGFLNWIEETYDKEQEIDHLYNIGKTLSTNTTEYHDFCSEIKNVIDNMLTYSVELRYSQSSLFNDL